MWVASFQLDLLRSLSLPFIPGRLGSLGRWAPGSCAKSHLEPSAGVDLAFVEETPAQPIVCLGAALSTLIPVAWRFWRCWPTPGVIPLRCETASSSAPCRGELAQVPLELQVHQSQSRPGAPSGGARRQAWD